MALDAPASGVFCLLGPAAPSLVAVLSLLSVQVVGVLLGYARASRASAVVWVLGLGHDRERRSRRAHDHCVTRRCLAPSKVALTNELLREEHGGYSVVPDDIAYWKQERAKLQQQLMELEGEAVQKASLPLIQYLKTRIGDLDRYIAATRRIA